MKNAFGTCIRSQREALRTLDSLFGLRQTALRAGLAPSHLSRIERGLAVPPSADAIERLARGLALDRDELLALAGKLAGDVRRTILKRPQLMAALVRQFADVPDEGVQRVLRRARRSGHGGGRAPAAPADA